MFNYLIVGAGFTGNVLAERVESQLGKKVLIVDRCNYIGGNAYDRYNNDGVLIHKYSPHIFHINSRDVSALNQTYPHTEVIVVDDGSTDRSREIIAGYGDRIIPILKENGGQASALNVGFAISKGEILCLLDSDDVWFPQKVECVVDAFSQYPNASVVYHKIQNVDKTGSRLDRPWPHKVVKGNIAKKVVKTGGWWPFAPSTGLSFYRKFLLQVMNIPEEDYRICADTYLADLAPFFGDVVGIDRASLMQMHGSNNWSNPIEAAQRAIHYHEVRAKVLNRVLQQSGLDVDIDLSKNLAYRSTKFSIGEEEDLLGLSLLNLLNPYDWRLHSRIKAAVNVWLTSFSKSR